MAKKSGDNKWENLIQYMIFFIVMIVHVGGIAIGLLPFSIAIGNIFISLKHTHRIAF